MAAASKAKGKNPAFQFYPADWLRDPALRSVTSGARGLWIDMLCLMWDCVPRGYLQTMSGKPFTAEMICRMSGNISKDEVDRWLAELEDSGVLSRSTSGVFYSRRMVRDEHKRTLCQEAGKLGGNPTLKGGSKGHPKGDDKGGSKGESNRKPTPSSSSSSSVDPNGSISDKDKPISSLEIPAVLNGEVFAEAWADWVRHRKEIKHALKYTQAEKQLAMFAGWGIERSVRAINHTVTMGWQGIVEPGAAYGRANQAGLFGGGKPDPTRVRSGNTSETIAAAMAEAAAERGE